MGERYAELPRMALSVRQPWAYALAMGWKPVENRAWRQGNPGLNFRGEFAIHASQGMTRDDYHAAADVFADCGFVCPPPNELMRGGVVGVARIAGIVTEMDSPWFFGPKGLMIEDAREVDFIPVGGQLGFFDWKALLPLTKNDGPTAPARWMQPEVIRPPRVSEREMRDRQHYEQAMRETRPLPSGEAK